jgi:hypothetical protein
MTDEQILELVKEHFTEEWCEEDGCGWTEFAGKPDVFVKFAQLIYEEGYDKGYSECSFDMGDENV